VETRRVCDKYGEKLTTIDMSKKSVVEVEFDQTPPTESRPMLQKLAHKVGLGGVAELYQNFKASMIGVTPE